MQLITIFVQLYVLKYSQLYLLWLLDTTNVQLHGFCQQDLNVEPLRPQ